MMQYPKLGGTSSRIVVIGCGDNRIYFKTEEGTVQIRDKTYDWSSLQHTIAYKNTDPTINDDKDSNYIVNDMWVNYVMKRMFVCTDNTIGAAVWDKIQGEIHIDTVDPTINDDVSLGYAVNDMWINRLTKYYFICLSNTEGAADWMDITPATSVVNLDNVVIALDSSVVADRTGNIVVRGG
jgi:hypothetical protein